MRTYKRRDKKGKLKLYAAEMAEQIVAAVNFPVDGGAKSLAHNGRLKVNADRTRTGYLRLKGRMLDDQEVVDLYIEFINGRNVRLTTWYYLSFESFWKQFRGWLDRRFSGQGNWVAFVGVPNNPLAEGWPGLQDRKMNGDIQPSFCT